VILRRSLNEAISNSTMTVTSFDDWKQTAFRHEQTTWDRAPCVLLEDLSADLVEPHGGLARCRSFSALRRLTRVAAQMSGLMCLTLIKMDERTAFRGWARTARLAADEAGDLLTHSWVRAQEEYGHYYSGNLTEEIHVGQHAQVLSGRISSVGAALAAALETLGPSCAFTRAMPPRTCMTRARHGRPKPERCRSVRRATIWTGP
jgi:hypothetical protein